MSRRPAKILYFSSFGDLLRGGQRSLFHLISNLTDKSFQAYVIVPNLEGGLAAKLQNVGIGVFSIELPKIKNLNIFHIIKTIWLLCKIIEKHEIDIIHTDGPRNTLYAGIAAKVKKIPMIWHIRASNKDRLDRFSYKMSSKIILVADALKSRFDWAVNLNKAVTIYNGVDLSEFERKNVYNHIRQKYGVKDKDILITVAARVEPLKGQIYLIEAIKKLRGKFSDFRILLAGEVVDNFYKNDCIKMATEIGVHDRVIFTGPLNNINQILNETDIFVLPSLFEAFPRSIIEAMASSIPVIVTDVGGNTEAIENNVSGLIVPAKNSTALAEKICFLGHNPELRMKIGAEARNRAEKLFGIRENVEKIEYVYQELLVKDLAT
jgi:glycosyltransferase involved in cell wall biosynthesis